MNPPGDAAPGGRSHPLVLIAAVVVLVVDVVVALIVGSRHTHTVAPLGPALGVLEADPTWIASDTAAGLRAAVLNVSWAQWQPAPGAVDAHYERGVRAAADAYRAAGWTVTVDPGLQQPPPWVLGLPAATLLDQHGQAASVPDFEFSVAVRSAASSYLGGLVRSLGTRIDAYRVGLSEHGEALYPDTSTNQWWAYSAPAQQGGPLLPPGVGRTPLPGWVPGSATYGAGPVSGSEVGAWYAWYSGAEANALAWEIAAYRAAGFSAELDLVMPGTGALPQAYEQRLAADLLPSPGDQYFTMNTAAVWWWLLDTLPDLRSVTVDISSVGDSSGTPTANGCQPTDKLTDYHLDPTVQDWSDTRWLTYLAAAHHLRVIGESPGDTASADVGQIVRLARSCGLKALLWAWDYQLHGVGDQKGLATLADLSATARTVGRQ